MKTIVTSLAVLLVSAIAFTQTPTVASFGVSSFSGTNDLVFESNTASYSGHPGYYLQGVLMNVNYPVTRLNTGVALAEFSGLATYSGSSAPLGYEVVLRFDIRAHVSVSDYLVSVFNSGGSTTSVVLEQESNLSTVGTNASFFASNSDFVTSPGEYAGVSGNSIIVDEELDWTQVHEVRIALTGWTQVTKTTWHKSFSYLEDFIQLTLNEYAVAPQGGVFTTTEAFADGWMERRCRVSIE